MPLLVQASAPPSPEVPVVDAPVQTSPVVTWTRDGQTTILTEDVVSLLAGARGLDMPPFQHYQDSSPAIAGAFSRGHRALTRELFLPLDIYGATRDEFLEQKRSLLRALDPTRGAGTLTWAERDGTRRHIDCYYREGMEGDYSLDSYAPSWQQFALVMECLDPYWYGDDQVLEWVGAQTQTFFPLVHSSTNFANLIPSQVLGSTPADNVGDVEAHPVWTINGPATAIELENVTTGKTLTLTSSLAAAANKRIIDTRPGEVSIVDEAGVNKWPELGDGSALWNLERGVNDLTITVTASTADTKARLVYKPRFNGV